MIIGRKPASERELSEREHALLILRDEAKRNRGCHGNKMIGRKPADNARFGKIKAKKMYGTL